MRCSFWVHLHTLLFIFITENVKDMDVGPWLIAELASKTRGILRESSDASPILLSTATLTLSFLFSVSHWSYPLPCVGWQPVGMFRWAVQMRHAPSSVLHALTLLVVALLRGEITVCWAASLSYANATLTMWWLYPTLTNFPCKRNRCGRA